MRATAAGLIVMSQAWLPASPLPLTHLTAGETVVKGASGASPPEEALVSTLPRNGVGRSSSAGSMLANTPVTLAPVRPLCRWGHRLRVGE